jgi:Abnormal spindle-like microcephaly-assoc'd, ASPM-SPD-2-Hydin
VIPDVHARRKRMPRQGTALIFLPIVLAFLAAPFLSGCAGLTSAGTGANSLAASKTNLNFGSVKLGGSGALGVTITNAGNSDIAISNVSISGAGFSASGVPTGEILTPGQTSILDVTFTPSATGILKGSVTVTTVPSSKAVTVSLSGTGVQSSGHSVMLSWMPSTVAVHGYNVYRSSDSGVQFTKLNSAPLTTTQYDDSTVQAGQTYIYAATSLDSRNVESSFSNEASVTIPTP